MSSNIKFKSSKSHISKPKRLLVWIKENILLILAPALLIASGHFFYVLGRLVAHSVFNGPQDFLDISIPFERGITLNDADSWLIIPYLTAYIYWVVMPFIVNHVLGKKAFYRLFAASLIANTIGFFIWAFLPTKQNAGVYTQAYWYIYGSSSSITVSGHGFIGTLLGVVYGGDCPDNLSPSQHNNMTFIYFLIFLFPSHKTNRRHWNWITFTGIAYVFVAIATIFLRQHAIMDIITGVAISACAAMFIGDHTKLDIHLSRVFDKLNDKLAKGYSHFKISWNYKLVCIGWIALWVLIVAFGFYTSLAILLGDPFKPIWYSDTVWGPKQWMDPNSPYYSINYY